MSFEDQIAADIPALMDVLGIPASLIEAGSTSKAIKVVFDNSSIDSMGILTDKPQVSLMTSDLDGRDLKNTVLTIKGTDYRILKPLGDGYGLSLATLTRI